MNIYKKIKSMADRMMIPCLFLLMAGSHSMFAQEVIGAQELRWLRVGELHTWFSSCGAEVEYGRRGRACCQAEDQTDNMYWQALYQNSDRNISKGMWLGTTDFKDPVSGKTYAYKVVQTGPRFANMLTNFMPEPGTFKMAGRFLSPIVVVDGEVATENYLNDVVDTVDTNLPADRMIVSVLHTNIGITVTRKIMAFSQQYHDNYFIVEYLLENTGVIDAEGTEAPQDLTGVYMNLLWRHAPGWEATRFTGWRAGNIGWGRNTVNDVFGQDPHASDFEMRGYNAYYGPHSASGLTYEEDWGCPRADRSSALGAPAFIGAVTIHADKSPQDHTDDPYQPNSTPYLGSDANITSQIDSYNETIMADQYNAMSAGHPADGDHRIQVGDDFADQYGDDAGGYIQSIGYGPYDLAVGDSVRIVFAEAVDGLDREKSLEVGSQWYKDVDQYELPDGSMTTDRNAYKKAWVWTAEDSILESYRRAINNYKSDYNIPLPPPPPAKFEVQSGGDRIILTWEDNATTWPNFDGYQIFRAIGRVDTFYTEIFSCDASDVEHRFEDLTAQRAVDYYYYIQTKDDGSTNDIESGVPLVSSKYYTLTNAPAYLRRQAKNRLDSIRVVPNPFHIRARAIQFENADDRIAFFGLPPKCKILIYTERGDLVNTIDHVDGSGDELWNCTTSSNQIIVSGLYIAYIEVTENVIDEETKQVKLRKGDAVTKKFIVIR
ncbi:hypothetical protein JW835_06185 [bacterium]|nr:hypothetical protein [bacterium]